MSTSDTLGAMSGVGDADMPTAASSIQFWGLWPLDLGKGEGKEQRRDMQVHVMTASSVLYTVGCH